MVASTPSLNMRAASSALATARTAFGTQQLHAAAHGIVWLATQEQTER